MRTSIILVILTAFSLTSFGQKIKVDGKLDFLKGAKSYNLEFDYSDMSVGKFDSEEEYVKESVDKKNEKEAGSGDKWKEAWESNRESRYEPKFEELINKSLEEKGIKAGQNLDDAPVTIVVKTTFTEPGFNVGVMRKPAYINAIVEFVDNSTGEVTGSMTVTKVPGQGGMGYDFDAGFRIQESYAKLGKEVGKYLLKKVL